MNAYRPMPLFRSFLTDINGHIFNHQENTLCSDFALRLADCVEAYGYPKAETKCKDYIEDFYECIHCPKQQQRVILMRKERERQFNAGERTEQYEKAPRLDSF